MDAQISAGGSRSEETLRRVLTERLELVLEWYKGMVAEDTGRFLYRYDPETGEAIANGSPIRDIATVWDVLLLGRFLGRSDLVAVAGRCLEHYTGQLVTHDGALILDPVRLGEPSGIAHSAFLILALLESQTPARDLVVRALADGILRQQRPDGSYRIHFGAKADDGTELYPGEAMVALMQVHDLLRVPGCLASVERGLRFHRQRFPASAMAPDERVFFANWQSQYAALLAKHTEDVATRREVRDYIFSLHDEILRDQFYERIERYPSGQATVEVACALEGVNDAWTIAARAGDDARMRAYARCARIALDWLLRAQRQEGCTPRERGGFGHSLANRTQRIDVTGHVAGGFMKTVRNAMDL